MILASQLEEQISSAAEKNDISSLQEIFMTLPNKKLVMNSKEYSQHIKDLFIFITDTHQKNADFYQKLLSLPLFDKINQDIVKDYSKFNTQIEKKFTQAVTEQYDKTVENLSELLKNPDFLKLFNQKESFAQNLKNDQQVLVAKLPHHLLLQQILLDLNTGSNSFKLERTSEFTGFLLGEATFAYQRYENSPELKKQFKSRQNYLLHVMDESTLTVQFHYKNPNQRHECDFESCTVSKSSQRKVKERSVVDSLSVSTTRKTIIPFISVSSRTLHNSLSTQSEQAARFLTHLQEPEIKKQIISQSLGRQDISPEEISQWSIEPQIMDIAPIDEWGKSKKGKKNADILLGTASEKNLGPSHGEFDFDKVNYRRELNHFTYLATLFSGVINDNFTKRRQHASSVHLAQANYWSIGVDTQEISQVGQYLKDLKDTKKKKTTPNNTETKDNSTPAVTKSMKQHKALHLYCAQKLFLTLQGLEQAPTFDEVLPEGSINKIFEILTVYHGICGSHGANCSNPLHKKDFPEYQSDETVSGLYKMGGRLLKWIERYPGGIQSHLELYKEFKALKALVGADMVEFKANMTEYERPDICDKRKKIKKY